MSSIKVDKITNSLQTFEITINDRDEKNNKGITFVSNTREEESPYDKKERMSHDIALLGGEINNSLKYLVRKWRTIIQYKRSYISP